MPRSESGTNGDYMWCIDFTSSGLNPGVIMTQSRMREIESITNPLGGLAHAGAGSAVSFGNNSWLDLLVSERITVRICG